MRGLVVFGVLIGCAGEPKEVASPAGGSGSDAAPAPIALADAGVVVDAAPCPVCPICVADEESKATPAHDAITLTKVKYADLPAWADDKHAEAVPSFLRSCEKLAALADNAPVGHDGHGGTAG
jgi:membrane-bound lytic murein transglycosylase A